MAGDLAFKQLRNAEVPKEKRVFQLNYKHLWTGCDEGVRSGEGGRRRHRWQRPRRGIRWWP